MTLDLAEKILRAFKTSLDALKPQQKTSYARAEVREPPISKNAVSTTDNVEDAGENNKNCIYSLERRKGKDESYRTVTSTPHHDGYQWRKYGEKKIRGTVYPRCYYRCTYLHDQNCQATKQVQQLNSDDPPMYDVVYNRRHTCVNVSGSRQNGEGPQSKNGCTIVFGAADVDDDDDEVTIISSSSTEMDAAVLRQLNQEATKRQRTNPPVGPAEQVAQSHVPAAGPGPSPSRLNTEGSTSQPVQPVSTSREETRMESTFLRHLNQEATVMLRKTPVMAPAPLSVAGPTPLSVVGPAAYSTAGGATPSAMGPNSSVLATVRSAVCPGNSISISREDIALDPSLMRHVNHQEAIKRLRTGLSSRAGPSAVLGLASPNPGERSGTSRPRHCTSFPPLDFPNPRFERSMLQNGNIIESLYTLPSERSLDPKIANPNSNTIEKNLSQIQNQMESVLNVAQVEGLPGTDSAYHNGIRVKRSFSDIGTQREGLSRAVMQRSNTSLLNPNLTRVRRSSSQDQNEMEGVFTLSSMDMLPVTNSTNPNSSRSDKSPSDINSANPNTRSTNPSIDSSNPTLTRVGRSSSQNQNEMEGVFTLSSMDMSPITNSTNPNSSRSDKSPSDINFANPTPRSTNPSMDSSNPTLTRGRSSSQGQNEMEGMFTLSSMDMLPVINSTNPNSIRSDKSPSDMNLANPNTRSTNPSIDSSNPTLTRVGRSSSQDQNEMEGLFTLSSMDMSPIRNSTNPNSSRSDEIPADRNLANPNTRPTNHSIDSSNPNLARVGRSSSQDQNDMEGVFTLSSMDMSPIASLTNPNSSRRDNSLADINLANPTTRSTNPSMDSSNPYMSRIRSLLWNRSQIEGALSMSPMDKRMFLETVLANVANPKDNEMDKNRTEGRPSVSSVEKSTETWTGNRDTDKRERSISQNENQMDGVVSRSSVERSCETNSANHNENEQCRSLSKNRTQMESGLSRSSVERSSDTSTVIPNSNEEDGRMLKKQGEMEAMLSLSSMERLSDVNLASLKDLSVGIELSLSPVERSHNTKGVGKRLPQDRGKMEGALSLSSMERSADTSVTMPDSRSEMASILTLAPVERSVNRDSEKSLALKPGQMTESIPMQKSSSEINLANARLLSTADRSSTGNQGEMDGRSSLSPLEEMPDTNPSTKIQDQMECMLRLPSMERSSEANMADPKPHQMESTSLSSVERFSKTTLVNSDANHQKHREILLELNLPPKSPSLPTEQLPPPPLSPPSAPPPPPPPLPQSSTESQKPTEEITHLEATVAELRSKLDRSKEEAVTTKEKVTNLEAEISAIKAATDSWQRIMAEEASRRVAEAVSRFASALQVGPSDASRRTEILFPGAEDDDDPVAEVPSLLSQLE